MSALIEALIETNYWHGKPNYNFGFTRHHYIDTIKKSFNNKLIKVIVGQRRSGKSYIVRQLIRYLINDKKINPKNIFYLNKELYEFENIQKVADLSEIIQQYQNTIKPKGKVYILIDEIQDIEEWEKLIVSLAQHPSKSYEIVITGSNSKLLSGELASKLSGRYVIFEIYPFSYREFLDFHSVKNNKVNFIKYLESSGLPEIYNIPFPDIHIHYFQSLKDTILLRDIMHRQKIRDYVLLEDLFLFLLHNVGNLISVPSILKYFKSKNRKADYTTVSNYLSYMEDAYLIRQAKRYLLKTKELLSGERKYYVNDLGFRNYLYPQLKKDIGAMLENIVFTHLRNAGFTVNVGYDRDYEIDFIAERNKTRIYIQVTYLLASDEVRQREFGAFKRLKDNHPKYVLSMDDVIMNHPDGIIHENVQDFILSL